MRKALTLSPIKYGALLGGEYKLPPEKKKTKLFLPHQVVAYYIDRY